MDELLKFDPIEVIVIVCGFIGTWYTLRADSKWHTEWIKKHSTDCDEQRKANIEILTEGHHERLGRIETRIDTKL